MNTIPIGVLVSLGISAIFCIALPVVGILVVQKKYKKVFISFLLGAFAFFVSQIVLRLPLIQSVLPRFEWYSGMASNQYLHAAFLGITAGLFEEVARFVILKLWFKAKIQFGNAVAFGLGHGGIEALIFVAVPLLNLFISAVALNAGTLQSLMADAPQAQIDQVSYTLYNLSTGTVLLSVWERCSAMTIHVALTLLVATGLHCGKGVRYLFLAIVAHAVIDMLCVVMPVWGITGFPLECVITVLASLLILYVLKTKSLLNKTRGK